MVPMGPLGTSIHNYGPTAATFDPERWLSGTPASAHEDWDDAPSPADSADEVTASASAAGGGGGGGGGAAAAAGGDVPASAAAGGAAAAAAVAAAGGAAASGGGGGCPDPLSFSVGPRDCVGQTLARLELQVVVAAMVAGFNWSPGHTLEELIKRGENKRQDGEEGASSVAVKALYGTAQYHITLQPRNGEMLLRASHRS